MSNQGHFSIQERILYFLSSCDVPYPNDLKYLVEELRKYKNSDSDENLTWVNFFEELEKIEYNPEKTSFRVMIVREIIANLVVKTLSFSLSEKDIEELFYFSEERGF